jgi:FkbM family methyltransferase
MNSFTRTFGFINSHPLAARHLFRAYSAFLSWQFRLLFSGKLIPVKFVGSTRLLAKRGLNGVTGNIYAGLHEFEEMAFLLHLLRDTDTFFDVGANVGSYTILAAGVCYSNSLCFEPVPATFEILTSNIALNELESRVTLINAAVGHKQEFLKFTFRQDATNHVITKTEEEQECIIVPVINLDKYRSELPILIKIDVEGFETEVLKGARELLNHESLKAIIIELNGSGEHYNFDERLIHSALSESGFRPYSYEPFSRRLTKLKKHGNCNTLYLRDISFISDRIKSGKVFKVFSSTI